MPVLAAVTGPVVVLPLEQAAPGSIDAFSRRSLMNVSIRGSVALSSLSW